MPQHEPCDTQGHIKPLSLSAGHQPTLSCVGSKGREYLGELGRTGRALGREGGHPVPAHGALILSNGTGHGALRPGLPPAGRPGGQVGEGSGPATRVRCHSSTTPPAATASRALATAPRIARRGGREGVIECCASPVRLLVDELAAGPVPGGQTGESFRTGQRLDGQILAVTPG